MTVLIAGAGIGGLTAALSLHAAGVDAVVRESAREIRPLGVGINLLPHAVRELTELGLGDQLAELGVSITEIVYADPRGRQLFAEPRGLAQGYRWPQYAVQRGELQHLLLAAVRERLGADAVRTGTRVVDFAQGPEQPAGVRVQLLDRDSGALEETRVSALVGADGLHSAVRRRLRPDGGPLLWSGIRMWRGVTRAEPFLAGRSMAIVRDGDVELVAYPIGGDRINWVAQVKVCEPGPLAEDADWNRTGRLADVLPYFEHWSLGRLDVPELLSGCGQILEYPMVDREPLPAWGRGRVTLLGDAAHPMYPVGANGASQSVVDARVLARELSTADDPAAGLARYEALRREATAAVVLANREMSRTEAHSKSAESFARMTDTYRNATGSDVAALNARASLNAP